MPYTAYPTAVDLKAALTEMSVTVPPIQRLTLLASQAAKQFEKRTGYVPFLAAQAVRSFDPPGARGGYYATPRGGGRILTLDNGLVTLNSLRVGDVQKTAGRDFYLRPANDSPSQYIEFAAPVYDLPQSIVIDGVWGYSATVPDDAWFAMLRMAEVAAVTEHIANLTGGLQSWSEGNVREEYGERPMSSVIAQWRQEADQVVAAYQRVHSWL